MMGGTHQKVSPLDWAGNKRVAELNLDTRKEHKEIWDGLVGEGQGLSDEDESRINDVAMDSNQVHALDAATVDHITVLEKPQHHSLAPIVQWERFLPLRTLKVLLVENDDSTRQVVSALLRNCCYEVTAVANGLEAWRVLQDLTNHIDLVLTEVVMPGWSGIGLLCKIMSHKTCKTIPVIMMSSNDSMGIVFKCLSKGAVDFLVKPIRKNELKNLWQHVWRRCHSSSGSGIQSQKFTKSKSEDDSVNNTGSNDEEGIGSFGLSSRNWSDNGSGTQSSWTKRPIEADSPRPGPHNSTCAQAIHPIPETFCCKKKKSDDMMGKDLMNESNQTDKFSAKITSENKDSVESPSLELCLKKLRSTRVPLNDERNVLKHSNLSAFSRYPASPPTVQALARYEDSSEATPQNQISYGSNSNDKCSTNPTLVPKPGLYKEASAFSFRRLPSQDSTVQPAAREKIDEIAAAPAIERSSPSPNQVQVQHHHHHYHHHHHHHVHASRAQQPDQDGSSVENLKENIACCDSSVEADAANYNLYGGNSGSNDGAAITAGGANMESAEKSGGDGSGGRSGGIIDDRFARREAALNKFRQKRKERNFGKKVRYQSRKRLAEERPRVRGQFVRRIIDNENQEEDG